MMLKVYYCSCYALLCFIYCYVLLWLYIKIRKVGSKMKCICLGCEKESDNLSWGENCPICGCDELTTIEE
jgi:hypothetical protein